MVKFMNTPLLNKKRSIHVKLLTKNSEIKQLIEIFSNYTGVTLPISYCQQGKNFFVFDSCEKIVGGFSIIVNPPFRFLDLLPNQETFKSSLDINDCFEVNAFFVDDLRYLKLVLIELFRYIKNDVNKNTLLLFFDNQRKSLNQMWKKRLKPKKIHEGMPLLSNKNAGLDASRTLYFGCVDKSNLLNFLSVLECA